MIEMPYFMTDDSWYYFDGEKYVLTDKAPEKAKQSLIDFYAESDVVEGDQ